MEAASVAGRVAELRCRKADGEFEARLVALSCAEPPQGQQWSLRLLADRVVELGDIDSVSHETVRRGNQAVAARRRFPHKATRTSRRRWSGFRCLPASLRCGLSVVCMERRPGNCSETREPIPAAPGRPAREDYEYPLRRVSNPWPGGA